MKNYQNLIGFILLSLAIIASALIIKYAVIEMADIIYQGLI